MTEAEAFLCQAWSDMNAGDHCYDENDEGTYCQTIGKYQQAVEKIVKGFQYGLVERGRLEVLSPAGRDTHQQVIDYITDLGGHPDRSLAAVCTRERQEQVRKIMALVPSATRRGRNTEYPFPDDAGGWVAPASPGVFSVPEVLDAKQLAADLYRDVNTALGGSGIGQGRE